MYTTYGDDSSTNDPHNPNGAERSHFQTETDGAIAKTSEDSNQATPNSDLVNKKLKI